jgi:glycosyltransferase involved in cell wall biosynthesis
MKVLQLCHKPPRPAIDGGCIAMNNITKGLLEDGHEVKVLSASTHKHPFKAHLLPEEYKKNTEIEAIFVDTKMNFVDAFSNLITRDTYNVSRFFSTDLDIALETNLKENDFDIVQLESLFMTPYIDTIRRFSKAKIILRSHNLEFKIYQRMARLSSTGPKKAYLNILASRLKVYELAILDKVDGIATISPDDTRNFEQFDCQTAIQTIPFGIDTSEYSVERPYHFKPTLFHLGAMDWMPNVEGMNWFLKEAWPGILNEFPQFSLHLAGKETRSYNLGSNHKNVALDGEVPSAKKYMLSKGIMIVPLLSGGGIRIKIIEGMAMGKVVISTSIGAQGIDVTHGKNILIADTGEEFVQRIRDIHEKPELLETISANARLFIEQNYDNSVVTRNLVKFYANCLKDKVKDRVS